MVKENKEEAKLFWAEYGDNSFFAHRPREVRTFIPSGIYEGAFSREVGGYYFSPKTLRNDNILLLPEKTTSTVLDNIRKFKVSKDKYRRFGVLFKRGILLHGLAGNGKTIITTMIANQVVEEGGIVIIADSIDDQRSLIRQVRNVEPDRLILSIMEDVDEYCDDSDFLAMLDGQDQVENIVYLATTNKINEISDRVKKRPSRFDWVIQVGPPSYDARKLYVENMLKEEKEIDRAMVRKLINDADGMSFACLKEFVLAVFCLELDYKEQLVRLKAMSSSSTSSDDDDDDDD